MRLRRAAGVAAAVGFIGTILAANWLTTVAGFVPVGLGFQATAGTFAAGFSLAFRDVLHDLLGRKVTTALIFAGAGLSFAISDPLIALASAAAFLVSELADLAVYSPLRRRSTFGDQRWATAVVASNVVGAVMDTAVFLGIAFGAAAILPALAGQLVGKAWATLTYLILGKGAAHALPRQSDRTSHGASHA